MHSNISDLPNSTDLVFQITRLKYLPLPEQKKASISIDIMNKMLTCVVIGEDRLANDVFFGLAERYWMFLNQEEIEWLMCSSKISQVKKWPGIHSRYLTMYAEYLLQKGDSRVFAEFFQNMYRKPYIFAEMRHYLRFLFCHLVLVETKSTLRNVNYLHDLFITNELWHKFTFASGEVVSAPNYLRKIFGCGNSKRPLDILIRMGENNPKAANKFKQSLFGKLFLGALKVILTSTNWFTLKKRERSLVTSYLSKSDSGTQRNKILVTRLHGGVGDIVMMNYALQGLRRKNKDTEIIFAVPPDYVIWTKMFTGIVPENIYELKEDLTQFSTWYNLGECPGSYIEGSGRRDIYSRIKVFCDALEISYAEALSHTPVLMENQPPPHDFELWSKDFLDTSRLKIAIQWACADSYRDYPHMAELASRLSHTYNVYIFHNQSIDLKANPQLISKNIRLIINQSPPHIVTLLKRMDFICSPDSSFVHIAAQINKPSLAICGPINGRIRTVDYPLATYIDMSASLKCIPCWRNELVACLASGGSKSVCMSELGVDRVFDALQSRILSNTKSTIN